MAGDLGTLIASEVTRAETDFAAFRARSLSIVGLSGGLVTLTSGFLALAAGSNKDFFPKGDRWSLVAALAAYVIAALAALVINLPSDVVLSKPEDVKVLVESNWEDEGWDQQVALFLLTYLESLRAANKNSAQWLTAAIVFEIAGITCTAVMAFLVMTHLG